MFNNSRTQVIDFLKGVAITLLVALLYILSTAIAGNAQSLRATPKASVSPIKKATALPPPKPAVPESKAASTTVSAASTPPTRP